MLILWGTEDRLTPSDGPVGRYFQTLPENRSNTEFIHLPGVGHCPMDEAPDLVADYMLTWLRT